MPSHWHLVLWPEADGTLRRFMGWLTLTRTQRSAPSFSWNKPIAGRFRFEGVPDARARGSDADRTSMRQKRALEAISRGQVKQIVL